jgi:hypothetical protein
MLNLLDEHGYLRVAAVVTIRDHFSMIQSQLRSSHVATQQQGNRNVHEAYDRIFHDTRRLGIPVHLAVYESLVHNPKALDQLLRRCGLRLRQPLLIHDANEKYFR